MTNKTAIRVLEHIEHYLKTHTCESCEEEHTAIALAIKALEETERTQGNCNTPLSELRWTDKLSVDNDGNIRDFSGNIVGHYAGLTKIQSSDNDEVD